MAIHKIKSHAQLAQKQWDRYTAGMDRGHRKYQLQAKKNENFYLGGGLQWDEAVKKELEAAGKPWLEENIIFSTINTVLGYQTQSRMDIAFKPREEGDQMISDILSKLSMFIVDQNKFPWVESQIFADGLIQQRGFFDIRMNFNENMNGDIRISHLDPLDVIPDPDAKSYDPDDWNDVIITSWMTTDDIKVTYGNGKYREVLKSLSHNDEPDFGDDGEGVSRNRFGDTGSYTAAYALDEGEEHARIIDRQWYKLQNREFWYNPVNGDLLPIPDDMLLREKKRIAKENEYEIITRLTKRVRWTVTTKDVILHDDWSPYDHFTVIPFFPYFRRGKTVGLVDNLIKTQEMINKVFSQILHIVNTTANSGWTVEENSLTNMETEDLEDHGADTGLVIEYKTGRQKPEKIEPNAIPTGLKDLVNTGVDLLRLISGVSETFQGGKGPEVSGTAIQSRVHQAAIQLATPIDNLFRTRNMVAIRLLKLIQAFYTDERTFMITNESSPKPEEESVTINKEDELGEILNDITVGKYDVVIADVPTQITFQNAQFQQALDMRKFGVQIPDDEMIRLSTLSRKNEIAKKISGEMSEEQQAQMQEQFQKQIEQLEAQIEKLKADTSKSDLTAAKQAAEIAQMIAENPSLAPIIDSLLASQKEERVEKPVENQMEMQQSQKDILGSFGTSQF